MTVTTTLTMKDLVIANLPDDESRQLVTEGRYYELRDYARESTDDAAANLVDAFCWLYWLSGRGGDVNFDPTVLVLLTDAVGDVGVLPLLVDACIDGGQSKTEATARLLANLLP